MAVGIARNALDALDLIGLSQHDVLNALALFLCVGYGLCLLKVKGQVT
jgi:hypothetical protein